MNNGTTRFAIIGAGAISQGYAQAFQTCDNEVEVVVVADTRADAAKSLAEVLGCPWFDSHRAIPDDLEIDAVLVCTPPASHPEICHHFIERKVHVLCEKPFAVSTSEAEQVIETGRAHGVHVTMASKFRYVDDVIRAKQIVDSGILGDIILFENAFTARVDMTNRWNADPLVSGGGVLIDNGTHSVDICRYFLGPLAQVQVMEGKRSQNLRVEDLSWSINKELDRYISVYGTQGTVFVGWQESKYRQSSSPQWTTFGHGYDKIQAFRSQICNFARALRGREILLINGEDALASVRVIEAAYDSLRENHWTDVGNGVAARA
jgi:predicted dehydrogenase